MQAGHWNGLTCSSWLWGTCSSKMWAPGPSFLETRWFCWQLCQQCTALCSKHVAAEYLKACAKDQKRSRCKGQRGAHPNVRYSILCSWLKILCVFDLETSSQSYALEKSVKPRTRTLYTVTVFQIPNNNFTFLKEDTWFLPIHVIVISFIIFIIIIIIIVCVPLSCSFRQNAPLYWCYKLPVGLASAPYENLFLTMRPTYRSGNGVPITTSPSGKVLVAAVLVLSVCG